MSKMNSFKKYLEEAISYQSNANEAFAKAWFIAWEIALSEEKNLSPLSQLYQTVKNFPALRASGFLIAVKKLTGEGLKFDKDKFSFNKKKKDDIQPDYILSEVSQKAWWQFDKEKVQNPFNFQKTLSTFLKKALQEEPLLDKEDKDFLKALTEEAAKHYGNEIIE